MGGGGGEGKARKNNQAVQFPEELLEDSRKKNPES